MFLVAKLSIVLAALVVMCLASVGKPILLPSHNITCTQGPSCQFFADVLLVVKLNPVRLLWLDLLLNFYGTGFPHIVFFSSLRKGDTTSGKYLTIGAWDTRVHMIDDNYGFCDHETVAAAMRMWPGRFSGYLYLSDDVLLEFWKLVGNDKTLVWKQKPTSHVARLQEAERSAMQELLEKLPQLRHRLDIRNPPFAATSGVYYVPSSTSDVFQRASTIFLRHRTYNEWGTPIVLQLLHDASVPFVVLHGKLVWGAKRLLARRTMLHYGLTWYHPVRASSETFARMTSLAALLHMDLPSNFTFTSEQLFTNGCYSCATHLPHLLKKKGLYHSCLREADLTMCSREMQRLHQNSASQGRQRLSLDALAVWHWPSPETRQGLVGGMVHVPADRRHIRNPWELDHEGFWSKEITEYVYNEYLPSLMRGS
jgi:hypothetical protein